MRADAEAILTDSAAIRRVTKSSNGQGGHTATWATVATVDCLLSPITERSGESPIADGTLANARRVFTFPADTDVRASDRILHDSINYEVSEVRAPRSLEFVVRAEGVKVA